MDIDIKKLEKQFHADGYRLGIKAADSGSSAGVVHKAVQQLHLMIDEVVTAFSKFAESHNLKPACKKGCSWCCYQPVFALSYELDNLHSYLKMNFSAEELEAVYARAALKRNKLQGLNGKSLLNSKFQCPLLENDVCLAYSARPVACRIYLSSDVNTCKRFYDEPDSKDAVPALMDFPMRMGRMINEGFRAALKASGVKVQEFRIEEFPVKVMH